MTIVAQIKKQANNQFAPEKFIDDLVMASGAAYSLSDIVAPIGINDPAALGVEDILCGDIQSLNSTLCILERYAFDGVPKTAKGCSQLALDSNIRRPEPNGLRGLALRASDDTQYFCGNMKIIREAVQSLSNVIQGDVESYATSMQKALISKALKDGYTVLFVDRLMEDADKVAMSRINQYLMRKDALEQSVAHGYDGLELQG